jgi:hypothetical protein
MNHTYIIFNLVDEVRTRISDRLVEWKIVSENRGFKWGYSLLCYDKSITWDIIRANPDIPWDYSRLAINPNITWEIVQANPDKPWNYTQLSFNKNITWDIIQSNPDKPWNYEVMCKNPNITWEIVQANPDIDWAYEILGRNPNITWEIVQANPDKPWDYNNFIHKDWIKWSMFKLYPTIRHESLCRKWYIVKDIIDNYPDDIKYISCMNRNITYDDIVKLDIPCDDRIVTNPNLTWEEAKEYFMCRYVPSYLIRANCITFERAKLYKDFPEFIHNENLTWKVFIDSYPHFNLTDVANMSKFSRQNASSKIQHRFKRWKYKIELEASTQFLYSVLSKEVFHTLIPVELTHYISKLRLMI